MAYEVTKESLTQSLSRDSQIAIVEATDTARNKTLGPLSIEDLATLMTAMANALDKIYPVRGDKPLSRKVDSRGRFGAYRFTIQQLVDAAYIDKEVISWAQGGLQLHGDGPYTAERRSSYADEAMKTYGPNGLDDFDFGVPRTEERNNIQYYLIENTIPSHIKAVPVKDPIYNFLLGEFVDQDFWAFKYLQFMYKLFITARIIDEEILLYHEDDEIRAVAKRTLAGMLSMALCDSYDATINFASGKEKVNTDGISSKYWYDIGWNAITPSKEKLPYDEPEPVKSPDVTAVANVSSAATSETPTPETAAAPASTTTDSGNPNATSQKSDTPPPPVSTEQAAAITPAEKPMAESASVTGDGFQIDYALSNAQFTASGYLTSTSRIICSGAETDRAKLQAAITDQINQKLAESDKTSTTGPTQTVAPNPTIKTKRSATITLGWSGSSGNILIEIDGNFVAAASPTDTSPYASNTVIQTLVDNLDAKRTVVGTASPLYSTYSSLLEYFTAGYASDLRAVKYAYDSEQTASDATTEYNSILYMQREVNSNFMTVTQPLENLKNKPVTESTATSNPDGTGLASTTIAHDDGSTTTIVTTTNADGTVSQEKQITPVAPAADTTPPKVKDDLTKVRNPKDSDPSVAESPNSTKTYQANNQPHNGNTQTSKGFKDPKGQYPKPDSQNKPDTNPLALGENSSHINASPKTAVGDKKSMSPGASPAARNATRKREVKKAGRGGTTWSQPETPYAAKYPYNKVFAGESGHALEIDDTPGAERLNLAHRSGTFTETGPDGTQVNKIVGDGYTIYDQDGYILIEGAATVHIAGACNVYVAGDTNLTMHGKASIDIHNDLDLNVGGHIAVSAGKGIFVRNQGIFSLDNAGDIEMRSKGKFTTEVVGSYNITTTVGYNMTSKGETHIKSVGASFHHSNADVNICSDAGFKVKAGAAVDVKAASTINTTSTGATNIKSGAAVNVEGVGNISLKAPLVTSSPIDTPTLDVTTANITTLNVGTLNAGATNLRATGTDTGTNGGSTHDLPISGPTSITASVTAPAAAADAAEAVCAVVAPLAKPVAVELPVSVSVGSGSASGTGANATGGSSAGSGGGGGGSGSGGGGGGGESSDMAGDGGEEDGATNPICKDGDSGSTENPTEGTTGESTGPFKNNPPYGDSDKGLPPIPNMNPNNPDLSFRLSPNFTLKDLTRSDYYTGKLVPIAGFGTKDILINLRALCVHFLEPLKKKFPGMEITSGYRTAGKKPSGGANLSAHMFGAAADLRFGNRTDGRLHIDRAGWIATNLPRCDQIIFEKNDTGGYWVHVGIVAPKGAPRGQKFSMYTSGNSARSLKGGLSGSKQGFTMQ